MKNIWRKKSKSEVDLAVKNKDFTGGYSFFPWMWHARKVVIMAFSLDLFIGFRLALLSFENFEKATALGAVFFGILVPVFMLVESIHSYKKLKKGISS